MNLVDSHCHLDDPQFDPDRDAVIARARQAGVTRMLAIGTGNGPPDLEAAVRLAEAHAFIYASAGVHPHDAAKAKPETFADLRQLTAHAKVLAVGEIGLDYHYDFSPREAQREVFRTQLELAGAAGKPVIIHTREAWADTLALIRNHWNPAPGGIMHCFTAGPVEAEQALAMGFHLSFGGIVTFPKANENREAARLTPEDRLLVETDCPYLAPVPHRGQRNEPAFMVDTVRRLAEVRSVTPERVAELTRGNFERLCLPSGPQSG